MQNSRNPHAAEPINADVRCGTYPTHRILLVDADKAIRQSCAQALILSGYKVDAAEDGATGWEALHDKTYDLVITDNNIPKMSGVELLKKMHAARMAMPVIVATETLPVDELTRYPWLQPSAMLPKPFTGDQLLGTVKTVLDTADSNREEIKSLPIWRRAFSRWFKAVRIPVSSPESD